ASGLEIRTRKPQFETLTRLVSNPRNPVVRISFNRLGRVANVELLESSRVTAVDDPVVTAVYNWTAAGEPLLKLPESDPNATVEVVIRLLPRCPSRGSRRERLDSTLCACPGSSDCFRSILRYGIAPHQRWNGHGPRGRRCDGPGEPRRFLGRPARC